MGARGTTTPVLGVAGYSGSGKTTLLEKLIPALTQRGIRVSALKHAHHHFDVDVPGKDSWRLRQSGAGEVLVVSARRWVLMHELLAEPEPALDELLGHLSPCDLVLVEGFKQSAIPKLEVWRKAHGGPRLAGGEGEIIGLVTDETQIESACPVFSVDDPESLATFITGHFGLMTDEAGSWTIHVKYFARLKELLDCHSETVTIRKGASVNDLVTCLMARGGLWARAFTEITPLRAALNQELVPLDVTLEDQAELALFPPVTGG